MEVVKAVITNDNKYLLQLRDNDSSITYPNTWSFFGGEVDYGESLDDALKRELEEELGRKPEVSKNTKKTRYQKANCNITFYLINCYKTKDKLRLGEGQAMAWFTYEEISDLLYQNNKDQVLVAKESLLAIDLLIQREEVYNESTIS